MAKTGVFGVTKTTMYTKPGKATAWTGSSGQDNRVFSKSRFAPPALSLVDDPKMLPDQQADPTDLFDPKTLRHRQGDPTELLDV